MLDNTSIHNISDRRTMNSSRWFKANQSEEPVTKFLIMGGWIILFTTVLFFLTTETTSSLPTTTISVTSPKDPTETDNPSYYDETQIFYEPKMPNSTTFVVVDKNEALTLNCSVANLPKDISLIWQKITDGYTVIAINSLIVSHRYKQRTSVSINEEGSELTIGLADESDAGIYECRFAIPANSPSIKFEVQVIA